VSELRDEELRRIGDLGDSNPPSPRRGLTLRWRLEDKGLYGKLYNLDELPEDSSTRFPTGQKPLPDAKGGKTIPASDTLFFPIVSAKEGKVTARSRGIELGELLRRVSKDLPETLEAERETAMNPVAISVKEMPLADFESAVAGVYGYRWKATEQGATLCQDEKSRAEEERLRSAERENERNAKEAAADRDRKDIATLLRDAGKVDDEKLLSQLDKRTARSL
jgi:hypothetical protein